MATSNESVSHDDNELFAEFTSLESGLPSDAQGTIDLPSLPTFDFEDLVGPLPELPELEITFPAFDDTTWTNLAQTHEREHILPGNYRHVPLAVGTVEYEVYELRHTIFALEQRLNVYDCILPQLQQDSKDYLRYQVALSSRIRNLEDYMARFVDWAFQFKRAMEDMATPRSKSGDRMETPEDSDSDHYGSGVREHMR